MSIHRLIHKGAALQFHGEKMNFSLSMGLFSSNDIDAGTKMLLKSLASELDYSQLKEAVDIGCGVGVIGVALKRKVPHCNVLCRDRDALALDFTRHNAQVNGIKDINIQGGLFLNNLIPGKYDLLLSNVPAKAGKPVIDHFIYQAPLYCSERGRVAIVVVSPLREQVEQCLQEAGHDILFHEHSKMYSVFHFKGQGDIRKATVELYVRHVDQYQLQTDQYELSTVYNLPDFDQVSWRDLLTSETLRGINKGGHWGFLNPGQGHIVQYLLKAFSSTPKKISLISRDLLQLKLGEYNLKKNNYSGEIENHHLAMEEDIANDVKEIDFLQINIETIPRVEWTESLKKLLNEILAPNGMVCLTGKSKDIQAYMKYKKGFTTMGDKKFRGWRCVVLKSQ